MFSKDLSGMEFRSVVNSRPVVKSRGGVGKVTARANKAERIRAFLGEVQRASAGCSPR